ncbi:MAG: hypothetical protein ACREUY_10180, partial [Burkholderiales bacterium]
ASISFAAEALISSLYSATPFQALDERFERKTLVVLPFGEGRKVLSVLGEGGFHRVVDHIGNRPIQSRSFQTQSTVEFGLEINGSAFLSIHDSIITL